MTAAEQYEGSTDELVVYGTGWCPDVRRSRALLDKAGVAYRYVDLDADAGARRLVGVSSAVVGASRRWSGRTARCW